MYSQVDLAFNGISGIVGYFHKNALAMIILLLKFSNHTGLPDMDIFKAIELLYEQPDRFIT